LSRLALATGGEINPKSLDKITKTTLSKHYRNTRQPFLILAFCLFLLEVAIRKFVFAEPD
jgi:hypothetical protein